MAAPSAYVRERPAPQGSRPPEPRERVRPSISSQILSSPAGVLLMLRFFLGVTFTFAGLQKLADPAYLDAKNPGSVQAQLLIYERMSPIHGIVHLAAQHAVLVGLLIAMGELAVGVGTLVGFWSRAAAVGGLLLSMAFWLTASWQSDPFYLSPDLVYLAAWTPIVFAGDGGLLSLEAVTKKLVDRDARRAARVMRTTVDPVELERRRVLRMISTAGVLAAATTVFGGIVAAAGRLLHRPAKAAAASISTDTPAPTESPSSSVAADPASSTSAPASTDAPDPVVTASPPTAARPTATSAAAHRGTRIGPVSAVPVGGAASFIDPATSDRAYVVQPRAGHFVAFDATCTHQGCPTQYASGRRLVCPCHGAVFDAATGAVLAGPARMPLRPIAIEVANGEIYTP